MNFTKIRTEAKYIINKAYFYSTVLLNDWLKIKEEYL